MLIRQTRFCLFLLAGLLFACSAEVSKAQTVRFNMDVQPELGVEVLQDLNFGTVVTNSGRQQVALGAPQMGIFKIRAFATQNAILTLHKPEQLRRSAQADTASGVPVSLDAAYSSDPDSYRNVLPFANNTLKVSLGKENITPGSAESWQTGYVFIFGNVYIGDIEPGSYSGTLVLNVVYE